MADDEFANEGTQDQNQQTGGGLRKQLEAALAELKAEREERAKLEAKDRQYTIDKVFSGLQVPDKVRKFYQGEPDEKAILDWVKENADVFGITLGDGATEPPEDKQRNEQLKQVQAANQVGHEPRSNLSADTAFAAAEARIKAGKVSERELDELLRAPFAR